MATHKPDFDVLTRLATRGEVQAMLEGWPAALTLPQANRLFEHLQGLAPGLQPLRLALVHTYTSDLLDPWLATAGALVGLDVQTYHAPYGLALQEASPTSVLVAHHPDLTLLLLQREDLHPDLARPIAGAGPQRLAELRAACLDKLRGVLGLFRAQPVGQLILSVLPALAPPALGMHDAQAVASERAWWSQLMADLATWMRDACPGSTLLDLEQLLGRIGSEAFFDRRYWYSARFPFTPRAALALARQVATVGVLLKLPRAKVLVLDADNTLWGGIIGEDGPDGIALGPDYPGNAYRDFQRRLLDFQQRGLLLAMCSKNNPADVDAVLREHPHQLLREQHFAARRVNWLPKADNLESLAKELNLGLDSFIFVDDSDHECAAMRHRLPQVEVVQVPSRAIDVPRCLDHLARLEVLALTAEDLAKTEMYVQERQRRVLIEQSVQAGAGAQDYLWQLHMRMRIGVDPARHVARLSQLSKKTNQFNLTTRRYDEAQMQAFIDDAETLVLDFSLADTFGDSGVVGLAIWKLAEHGLAELDTYLMSCRVIGRQAESAFLHTAFRLLAQRGVRHVVADYLPTAKNELVRGFLAEQGFRLADDGRHHLNLAVTPPQPAESFPINVDLVEDVAYKAAATSP